MKKLKVFETFAGIGAQNKALTNLFNDEVLVKNNGLENKHFEVVGTSEWYIDGIISYDAIHHGKQNTFPNYKELNKEEMLSFLKDYDLSKDSKNLYPFNSIKKLSFDRVRQIFIALKRNKNYGSILNIKGKELPKIDMLTYSFPCQDLSNIGKGKGIKKNNQDDCNTATRSGLLWEIERILFELKELNKLPKFLVMENVKALIQKNHYPDWLIFEKNVLEKLGYKNTTMVLNALDFNIPQNRERVFVISELNGISNINVESFCRWTTGVGKFLDWSNNKYKEEYLKTIPNNTPSRKKMWEKSKQIFEDTIHFQTITTKQDRHPNCGNIYFPNKEVQLKDGVEILKSQYRFITPRESLLLMGFTNKDYEILLDINMSKDEIWKQTGNSIAVNVLEGIFLSILRRF
jgi:DNA (cytosine-5)-methyltransferase 1